MSNDSMKVIVFANNEEKELRARGQELARNTFPGMHVVNRSPRYFSEESSVEPCAAIFINGKAYPEICDAYSKAGTKVLPIVMKKEEKTSAPITKSKEAKSPKLTLSPTPNDAASAEERE